MPGFHFIFLRHNLLLNLVCADMARLTGQVPGISLFPGTLLRGDWESNSDPHIRTVNTLPMRNPLALDLGAKNNFWPDGGGTCL